MTRLGTLTIGQAPRPDVAPLFEELAPAGLEIVHAGVLDGLTAQEASERFAPAPGEPLLTSRLLDGTAVVMGKGAVRRALEGKIADLEAQGCDPILLLCTGEFEGLHAEHAALLEPDRIIPPAVAALCGDAQVGVLVPLPEQAQSEHRKWACLARPPVYASASPYLATREELQEAARSLERQGARRIVLDCIGYSRAMRDICREAVSIPVLASSELAVWLSLRLV